MKATVLRPDPADEFHTGEMCHILELSNSPADSAVSIARARVEPGVTTRWHWLRDTAERYCILSGRGLVEVGELPSREVRAGDIVLIPPGMRQRIANIGQEDLVFLAICTPRFSADVYEQDEDRSTT